MLPASFSSLDEGFQLSMDHPLKGIWLQIFPDNLCKQLASKSRLPGDSVVCLQAHWQYCSHNYPVKREMETIHANTNLLCFYYIAQVQALSPRDKESAGTTCLLHSYQSLICRLPPVKAVTLTHTAQHCRSLPKQALICNKWWGPWWDSKLHHGYYVFFTQDDLQ